MTGFWRAIKESMRYKWSLAASVVNALLIGLLWGVSITAVYPFVEIVLQGKTVSTWFDDQVDHARQVVDKADKEVAELQRRVAAADGAEAARLRRQVASAESAKATDEKWLAFFKGAQPWVRRHAPSSAFSALLLVMGLLVLATIIKGICLVLETLLVARVANRTVMDMRRQFYRAALEMDQRTLDGHGTSSLMSQIVHNTDLIGQGLSTLYGTSVREPLKMLACLVSAAFISWQLLLLSLVVAPLGGLLVHFLATRTKRVAMKECKGMAGLLETILETLGGIKTVKIYNREATERRRFKRDISGMYRMGMNISASDAVIRPVTELTGILTIVVAILVGAHLVLDQQTHLLGIRFCARPLSAAALFMFYAMLAGVADPARKMGDIYTILIRASAACKGLYAVFEAKPQIVAPPNPKPVPRHCRNIRLDNVRFAYVGDRWALDGVSFEIPFGQTVALVGQNGCGKSTVINLLTRFYDPQEGAVSIDGIDIREVNPKKLRRQMAVVSQDPILFRGTVRENIAYSLPAATEEQILTAAKQARVDDYISTLARGYETEVGDRGNSLSGGQRQRVALARAILIDPRILMLDEATSQIDQHSEELIQDTLRDFLAGRTTILVTHRPSTIRLAQRVIMMDHGKIVDDLSAARYLARYAPGELSIAKAA
jgi:ATP-binding cassette subfamily B protein/subfamily B ATP-binding cassette protein MsbA